MTTKLHYEVLDNEGHYEQKSIFVDDAFEIFLLISGNINQWATRFAQTFRSIEKKFSVDTIGRGDYYYLVAQEVNNPYIEAKWLEDNEMCNDRIYLNPYQFKRLLTDPEVFISECEAEREAMIKESEAVRTTAKELAEYHRLHEKYGAK